MPKEQPRTKEETLKIVRALRKRYLTPGLAKQVEVARSNFLLNSLAASSPEDTLTGILRLTDPPDDPGLANLHAAAKQNTDNIEDRAKRLIETIRLTFSS